MTDDDYLWDPGATPSTEIARLESALHPFAHRPAPLRITTAAAVRDWRWRASIAAALVVVVGTGWVAARMTRAAPWSVSSTRGAPRIRTADGSAATRLDPGGVVETDASSSARVALGTIGHAELAPGSRLRLLRASAGEHRLALDRGTLRAAVNAPPRMFLVETPSAVATDLGCAYTLEVDDAGRGSLLVEEGEVELEGGGASSSVLAGNRAELRPGAGPGLPYPVSASAALRRAVAAFDAAPRDSAAVDAVLAAADVRSTITLWHLLRRAEPRDRARVFDRLAVIAPPPRTVTRAGAVRGESFALQRWRTDLQRSWASEPSWWRHVWLTMR